MKDTGRWVGSRWSRVKHSGITEFFYNKTNLPSIHAFTSAPPPTYLPSLSLCTCSDPDSPSHLDTWDLVNRRMENNQMFCFYWSRDSDVDMRNVSLSPLSILLSAPLWNQFFGDWIWTWRNLQLPLLKLIVEPAVPLPSPFPLLCLFYCLFLWGLMTCQSTLGKVQWRWNKPCSMPLRFQIK